MTLAVNIAQSGSNNVTFRNRFINGAMVIDQRNAGAAVTAINVYALDRYKLQGTQSSKINVQQNAASVTPPAGFTYYLGATSQSAFSVAATDYFRIFQPIEGFNTADFAWGTASASPVTLSFWVRSSLTGTHGGSFSNNDNNRYYVYSYTISSANTWEYKTITVAGDTSGTWKTDNNIGIQLGFNYGTGTTYSGTAGSWGSTQLLAPTGAVSVVGTSGATFYITGVQLEAGTTASPFEYRQYGTELALCQRYYYQTTGGGNTRHAVSGNGSLSQAFPTVFFKVTMRTTPSISYSSLSHFTLESLTGGSSTATAISANAGTNDSATLNVTTAGSGGTGGNLLGNNASSVIAYSAEL